MAILEAVLAGRKQPSGVEMPRRWLDPHRVRGKLAVPGMPRREIRRKISETIGNPAPGTRKQSNATAASIQDA
jgi:hypothetical protein